MNELKMEESVSEKQGESFFSLTKKVASRRSVLTTALGAFAVCVSGVGSLAPADAKTRSSMRLAGRKNIVRVSGKQNQALGRHGVRQGLKQSLSKKKIAGGNRVSGILVPRSRDLEQTKVASATRTHRVLRPAGDDMARLATGTPFNPQRGPLILSRSQNNLRADGERRISLYNKNTGEKLTAVYWADGDYVRESLMDLNYLLRDYRDDTITSMSLGVIDSLYDVRQMLDYDRPVEVVSGYRSPRTNAMLRRNHDGVARNSYHTKGQALDIVMPGRDLRQVRNAALQLNRGGVGYYAQSNFVHLDSGPLRTWNG